MHINQCVEGALGAAEQPVDRAFFIALHMIVVEILEKIVADVTEVSILAQCCLNEFEVFLVVFLAKGYAQELAEALGDIVGEPVAVEHGDNIIVIR